VEQIERAQSQMMSMVVVQQWLHLVFMELFDNKLGKVIELSQFQKIRVVAVQYLHLIYE
jgi:hypothetical protein